MTRIFQVCTSAFRKFVEVEMENLLTAEDVAVRFGMLPSQIYYHARLGRIPCVRIGRSVRFVWSQIERWIEEGGSRPQIVFDERPDYREVCDG
jgi:predicted DNA-binding transcriptional regulator AlpA